MEKLIENEKVTLKVYPGKNIIHHKIKDFISGDRWKELMKTGIDAYKKHDCNKWLSDDRGNSALKDEDEKWAQEYWEPQILEAGWDYWAILMPEKAIGQMTLERLKGRYEDKGVEVKVFSDTDEALGWLEEQ